MSHANKITIEIHANPQVKLVASVTWPSQVSGSGLQEVVVAYTAKADQVGSLAEQCVSWRASDPVVED